MPANETAPQKRKITLAEIARSAQVSKSTVSLVLNDRPNAFPISDETRARVKEAARKLGYRPNAAAKALVTGRSHTILVVAFDLRDDCLLERFRGIEAYLRPRGYSTRMCTVDGPEDINAYAEVLRSGQADGVLLTGPTSPKLYPIIRNLREEADAVGVPIAALVNAFPRDVVPAVADIDDESAAEQAVEHLIGHGRRRIVFLGAEDQPWAANRERGYKAALKKAGIALDPELIAVGERSQSWAYETALRLAKTVQFDAMFAAMDTMAVAALLALKQGGKRVPEDCAIIGFDDLSRMTRYTDPPLTTMANPFYQTGEAAAKMLVHMIEERPLEPISLPVTLVPRRSCGCPYGSE